MFCLHHSTSSASVTSAPADHVRLDLLAVAVVRYADHRDQADRGMREHHFLEFSGYTLTWCARTGLTGSGVSLESYNYRGSFLRHINAEVWLSDGAGGAAYNSPTSWA